MGYTVLLLVGAYLGFAHIYSNYPLRLKRIPGIAGLCIGLATLSALLSGFLPWSAGLDLSHFPLSIAIYLTIAIGIASTAKDLKDQDGDRADGTVTLPTILGNKAENVIFGLVALVILALTLIYMTWAFIISGVVPALILSIAKKVLNRIGDKLIFISYLIYLLTLLIIFSL
jgi:4-hydroxybenzoate polyprenyltransferase